MTSMQFLILSGEIVALDLGVWSNAAAGKSPFWRGFVSPCYTGVDAEKSVFSTHPRLWADGGRKGLHIAQATDADLVDRMMETGGKNF